MAALEVSKVRRKMVTYGKSNKRLPLHNIFDISPEQASPALLSSSSTRKSLDSSSPAAVSADESPDTSALHSSQSPSVNLSPSAIQSMFDIEASDQDSQAHDGSRAVQKRRKLTPVNKLRAPEDEVEHFGNQQQQLLTSGTMKEIERLAEKQNADQTRVATERTGPKSQLRSLKRAKPMSRQGKPGMKLGSQLEMSTTDEDPISSRQTSPSTIHSPRSISGNEPKSPSIAASDNSDRISPAPRTPPKSKVILRTKKKSVQRVSSPSQLALKSLRITPDMDQEESDNIGATAGTKSTQLTPRRGRQRLIDRLDSPRQLSQPSRPHSQTTQSSSRRLLVEMVSDGKSDADSSQEPSIRPNGFEKGRGLHAERDIDTVEPAPVPVLTRTYAQQRSHLSDMMTEDADIPVITTTPDLGIQSTSQDSTFSSFKSQLELESSDTDDQAKAGNLRSIHELRQAGANNRFERELDTLLEDVELKGATSKALRLQALMQFIKKLGEPTFVRRFIDAGIVNRLAAISISELDLLSGTLLIFAFAIIGHVDGLRPDILSQMVKSMFQLSSSVVEEKRNFAKIAKDRKQNLSKALVRELTAFELKILSNEMWDDHRPKSVTPQILFLQSIATSTLGLQNLRRDRVSMPVNAFRGLVYILKHSSHDLLDTYEEGDTVLLIELAISVLERSQPQQKMVRGDEEELYPLLGHSLARILRWAAEKNNGVEQATLRVVANFSNNKSKLSSSLASTDVVEAVVEVIEANFMCLAKATDVGDDLDAPKLDCVILALACLLNFVDCSREARMKMIESKASSSIVEWLVATFNERVGKSLDATTFDQSRVLVAFGYLSMLLCSLCTDHTVRPYIIQRLHNQSLNELCLAGQSFFVHLKELDVNPNDGVMSAFTEHFGAILSAMRSYATE